LSTFSQKRVVDSYHKRLKWPPKPEANANGSKNPCRNVDTGYLK